mmetsp:Transcript_7503/g.17871  ORF Transcript_7503/g.17871 Transcript_7503/m.17871 type:complete len:326 (+) Transcript_7503:641-1618(+)
MRRPGRPATPTVTAIIGTGRALQVPVRIMIRTTAQVMQQSSPSRIFGRTPGGIRPSGICSKRGGRSFAGIVPADDPRSRPAPLPTPRPVRLQPRPQPRPTTRPRPAPATAPCGNTSSAPRRRTGSTRRRPTVPATRRWPTCSSAAWRTLSASGGPGAARPRRPARPRRAPTRPPPRDATRGRSTTCSARVPSGTCGAAGRGGTIGGPRSTPGPMPPRRSIRTMVRPRWERRLTTSLAINDLLPRVALLGSHMRALHNPKLRRRKRSGSRAAAEPMRMRSDRLPKLQKRCVDLRRLQHRRVVPPPRNPMPRCCAKRRRHWRPRLPP